MLAQIEITASDWAIFVVAILIFLALDLGVFHRKAHVVGFREAFAWTAIWFVVAICFGLFIAPEFVEHWGKEEKAQFITGYIIELSLSMDNVFVIALIFTYFRVPSEYQHRVLFWGILGALLMRGLLIGVGVALIDWLDWILYVFGAFIVYTGVKMFFVDNDVDPEKNKIIRLARKFFPITPHFDGQKFRTEWNGAMALTPLALVLLMVETTDLLFAFDSIPAIFAVTRNPFIVFTSNVFAILGLRSLYFVLAGAIEYFRYLKYGLAVVLVFIGVKMLIDPHDEDHHRWFQVDIPILLSLLIVAGIIAISILLSLIAAWREKKNKNQPAK